MTKSLILNRDDFCKSHLLRYRNIFATPPTPKIPFANTQWFGLLFEGSFIAQTKVYDALRTASVAMGDNEFVLTSMYGEDGFETSILAPWPSSLAEFLSLRISAELDFTPASELFGATSPAWGCCFFFDEYFHVGGEKAFIDLVTNTLGCVEKLRSDFYRFAAHDWPLGAGDRDAVLQSVGW